MDYGIATLSGHRDLASTFRELERFSYPRMGIEGRQIIRAMVDEYGGRVVSCIKVPRKWVRIRNGLGVWLPAALKIKLNDGTRLFIIIQPRRSCDAIKRYPGLLLSLFSLHHAIEDDRNTPIEILDLQCSKGAVVRPRRVIRAGDVKFSSKSELDEIFSIYADAMLLIVKSPRQFGISDAWAQTAQAEFDLRW
ncbi:MAG: hypothetical protein WDN03_13090 [Rhizomicrobium sp.]